VRTAVDTSVLLDVFGADPTFGGASRKALRAAYDSGSLVACDVVWAEVKAHFEEEGELEKAATALGLEFTALSEEAAVLAGKLWRQHRRGRARRTRAGEAARRVTADFLVGAHALLQADRLLTRDRGFYRAYFKGLRLVIPTVR
jgi:predicted nucleic acid-binding protein